MVLVAGFRELYKIRFRVALLEQELGGLRYIGQIRLGGSLSNPCIPTDYLVDQLPLGGWRRGFSPSFLVSFLITHRRVILCLHHSFILFQLSYYCCILLFMAWGRSLEGLGTSGRLGLEDLLLTHVSQLIIQWINYRLEGDGEVFRRVLRFSLR